LVIKESGRYKETLAAFTRQTIFLGDYSYLYQHEAEIDYWREENRILINGLCRGLVAHKPADFEKLEPAMDHFYLQDRYLVLHLDRLKEVKNPFYLKMPANTTDFDLAGLREL